MSPFFIKHPVIATVIAVVTTLLGLVCLMNLPISQYPEITPRTIQLMAMFPGADAKAVADSVGTPLEREISGVADNVVGHVVVHVLRGIDGNGVAGMDAGKLDMLHDRGDEDVLAVRKRIRIQAFKCFPKSFITTGTNAVYIP